MPTNGWSTKSLGEVTENLDSVRVPVKEADRRAGPYPYYGASGVVDHVDGYLFDGEYLLIAEDGENLRSRKLPIAFIAQGKFWVNNHAHIVRGNHQADTRFLCYALSQTDVSGYLTGSTMPKLTQGNMNRIPVFLPPLTEQLAVVSALGALDELIELNRNTNQILEEMARALFKSWFVDFDPVRAKLEDRAPVGMDAETAALFPDHFEDTQLGQIPKGWRVGFISDIATIENQSVNPGSDPERVWEHYSIPAFDAGAWPASDKGSEIKSGKYRISDRVVLLSKLNPDTPRVWLPDLDVAENAVCSTEFLPFVPREADHRSFLFELLRSEPVFLEVCNRATGSTGSRQRVKPADVERIQTVIPLPEIIEAFVLLAGPLHDMIASNRRESRDLAALRDTLLPKLLSGEVEAPCTNP